MLRYNNLANYLGQVVCKLGNSLKGTAKLDTYICMQVLARSAKSSHFMYSDMQIHTHPHTHIYESYIYQIKTLNKTLKINKTLKMYFKWTILSK